MKLQNEIESKVLFMKIHINCEQKKNTIMPLASQQVFMLLLYNHLILQLILNLKQNVASTWETPRFSEFPLNMTP